MLFKTTIRLVDFAKLASTVNFSNIAPTLRMVEEQHIIPVLGYELYNTLTVAYTAAANEGSLTTQHISLLEKTRNVIGPVGCYYYAPKAEVLLSDAGAQRLETATNKTAYQNQVVNFREQNLRESEMATELLLQFLEKNKADYSEWTASEAFKDYRSLFIKSGSEFNKCFPSASPWRNYIAMRGRMVDVEEISIREVLGNDLFEILKTKDLDALGTFTDKEQILLYKVKKAVAYLTVASSIPFLNVRLDANGISVKATAGAQNDDVASRVAALNPALNSLIEASREGGKTWINNISEYMKENAVDFGIAPPPPADANQPVTADYFNEEMIGIFGLF